MWHDDYTLLSPVPQRWQRQPGTWPLGDELTVAIPFEVASIRPALDEALAPVLPCQLTCVDSPEDADLILALAPDDGPELPAEGYTLTVSADGIRLVGADLPGLFYGVQTLTQLAAMGHRQRGIPLSSILDWPTHRHRWLMVDLGRATFSLDYLKLVVRLAARLKYNGLHLHLHDNELNPVLYADTPLGMENPAAMPLSDFAELIDYAAHYHVEIIPELESWGHAGSILQHYPHLYGATRLHGYGHSFGIGPATFDLLAELYDQWWEILPDGAFFHVGLDEANWRLLDGADPAIYHRQSLVRLVHDLVHRTAATYGKQPRLVMWGLDVKNQDVHVPPELRADILLEPWTYRRAEDARAILARHWIREHRIYTQDGRIAYPFIAGGGASGIHEQGAVLATQAFAHGTRDWPYCYGVDVTLWGTNDLGGRLISLFAGAHSAWNPVAAEELIAGSAPYEERIGTLITQMRHWQALHPDSEPDAINRLQGEEVVMGTHRWGARHGQPVAPIWMPDEPHRGDADRP